MYSTDPSLIPGSAAKSPRPMAATMLRGPRLSGTSSTISRWRATRILMPRNIANGTSDHPIRSSRSNPSRVSTYHSTIVKGTTSTTAAIVS